MKDAESGFSSWAGILGPSGSALPAVPGPPPPAAGLPSHEVAAAALSAMAAASAVSSSSFLREQKLPLIIELCVLRRVEQEAEQHGRGLGVGEVQQIVREGAQRFQVHRSDL